MKSVMRRQLIPQTAGTGSRFRPLLTQLHQRLYQLVDLLLLAHDDLIELVDQVFLKAEFDFQLGDTGVKVLRGGHSSIGHQKCLKGVYLPLPAGAKPCV
jgi:hypothetical protein